MLKFNRQINYEPSQQLLKFWLMTRKSKYQLQLVNLPGLFQTRNFTLDTLGFIIVLICEVLGLMNLMRVAQDFKFIYAIGLFAADVLFAILYHLPKGHKISVANEMVLTTDTNLLEDLKQSLFWGKLLQYFSATIIIALAAFKVWGFYGLYGKGIDGLSFFIMMCYAVAATLHLICTGNFLFETFLKIRLGFHQWFHRNTSPRNSRQREFITNKALKEYSVGPHSIKLLDTLSDGKKRFLFEAKGVLEDSDLHLFIEQQTQGLPEKQLVATKGLELQLEAIGKNLTNSTYE